MILLLFYWRFCVSGKDNSIETNRIDVSPGHQQQVHRPQQAQRAKPDGDNNNNNNALEFRPHSSSAMTGGGGKPTASMPVVGNVPATAATVTSTGGGGGDIALTSPKRGDAPEELVPTNGAYFFALGCGSALIVTLVAVTSALAYKRTNKSLLRSKSRESMQWVYRRYCVI